MQIIIPMSGFGQRFINAGYKDVKPLIKIDGKRMIEYVIDLFPRGSEITFVCSNDHLTKTDMAKVLKKAAPRGKVVGIDPHKLGPVYSVSKIFDEIRDADEVVVTYCDMFKHWNFRDFLRHTRNRKADAAVVAHKGFHPHMLTGNNYALAQAENQWMKALAEKKLLNDIDKEYVLDGTHYFSKGSMVKKYFQKLMDLDVKVQGEYYVSVVYNLLLQDGLKVSVYEPEQVICLGYPDDVKSYEGWSRYFRNQIKAQPKFPKSQNSVNLIPLAGRGSRFAKEGYKVPKPLIEVSGKPMIAQVISDMPNANQDIFVCLKEHLDKYPLKRTILRESPGAKIVSLNQVTEGQACTCEIGIKDIDPSAELFITACDSGLSFKQAKYRKLIKDKDVDVVVWGTNHCINSRKHPEMYGWIKLGKDNEVKGISVKKPISKNPYEDYAIIGTFYFKRAEYFLRALQKLYKKNKRIGNEFYVDSCIDEAVKMGLKAKMFPVEHFPAWGTPNELKAFEFWQKYFHNLPSHPYMLQKDRSVNKHKLKSLLARCKASKRQCK